MGIGQRRRATGDANRFRPGDQERTAAAENAYGPGFLEVDNVALVPHIGSATRATRTAMAMLASRNLAVALSGRRPPNLLNPEAWPKRRR